MHLPVALPSSAPDSAERPFLPVAQSHLLPDCYRTRDRWYHFPSISRSPLGRNFSIQDTVPCCLPPFHANLEGLKSTVFKIALYYSSITSLSNNTMLWHFMCSVHYTHSTHNCSVVLNHSSVCVTSWFFFRNTWRILMKIDNETRTCPDNNWFSFEIVQ